MTLGQITSCSIFCIESDGVYVVSLFNSKVIFKWMLLRKVRQQVFVKHLQSHCHKGVPNNKTVNIFPKAL